MKQIQAGEVYYDFIEVMSCEGGCIAGGGQPRVTTPITPDIKNKRALGLYNMDNNSKLRNCYENPDIISIYDNYLGRPLSDKSHELLHTKYVDRSSCLKASVKE